MNEELINFGEEVHIESQDEGLNGLKFNPQTGQFDIVPVSPNESDGSIVRIAGKVWA